jgi:nicotinamidase-related amidase
MKTEDAREERRKRYMVKKILIGFGILFIILLVYTFNEYRLFSKTYRGIHIDNLVNKNSALLIIDIQNDLTQPNGKVHVDQKQVNQIISNINKLSCILNDNNFDIIYIRHEYKSPFFKIILKNALSEKSDGANFDERLKIHDNTIFIKNYMDPFSNRKFQQYLNSKNIGNLLISGIDAKYCIDKTALSAIQKGYNVTVLSDGIAGSSDAIRNNKISDYQKFGAKIIETAKIIKRYE